LPDIKTKCDIELIVQCFYERMLSDSIIGFIFTDVAKIQLEQHLPVIVNFWSSILFKDKSYKGNALEVHMDLHKKMPLTPGHFTRWLYLFNQSIDQHYSGDNTLLMKQRAELVAKSISAAIAGRKKGDLELVLKSD